MTPDRPVRRSLLSIRDLDPATVGALVGTAVGLGRDWPARRPLDGLVVGTLFQKTSTRTRTSFTVAAMRLGAHVMPYGPHDLQLVTGESVADTARVLAQYLDVLVIRTNGPDEEFREWSAPDGLAVVNAMSAGEHPTQVIGDLATLTEHFGSLDGLRILYVGEGNNTCSALARAVTQVDGLSLEILCPPGYGLPPAVLDETAHRSAGRVRQTSDIGAVGKPDVVYTTRWQTMGVPKADPHWHEVFAGYRVTAEFMQRVGGGAVLLHDLPAVRTGPGSEVADDVLDGPASLVLRQAFHKMTAAAAVLQWCAGR